MGDSNILSREATYTDENVHQSNVQARSLRNNRSQEHLFMSSHMLIAGAKKITNLSFFFKLPTHNCLLAKTNLRLLTDLSVPVVIIWREALDNDLLLGRRVRHTAH